MNVEFVPVLLLFSLVSLSFGLFLLLRPLSAIEFQIKFYEKINWRMMPISMPREIRNTRLMGLLLVLVAILTAVYIIIL
ncbi:MAG: hypothetical protein PHU91_02020 [Candidatus Omnitrophica bacterium]|nr:hypothetical protein [Candidatus Omnitrophota bacterium]MDD5236431.1 hypothetical protein [Candidatus Omnitrophota bacterium]